MTFVEAVAKKIDVPNMLVLKTFWGVGFVCFLPRLPQMLFRAEILQAYKTFVKVLSQKKFKTFLKCFTIFLLYCS